MTTLRRRIGPLAAIAALAVCASLARAGAHDAPAADVARGQHIATALAGCADCHGANFAGGRAFKRGDVTVYAANLTGGTGGIANQSDADVRRAIRAGVLPDGTHLRVMPVGEYAVMTDADVDDLIAYLRSLPPVDDAVPRAPAPDPSASGTLPAATAVPRPAPTGGAYIATIGGCLNCHGANLGGGARPGGFVAPNISHDGIGSWSFADFQTAMRTGKTPSGHVLSTIMPWPEIGRMTDAELRSLYDFLESQPAANG